MVDSLLEKACQFISYGLGRAGSYFVPFGNRVGAIDAMVGTAAFGLKAGLSAFVKIAGVVYPTSTHGWQVP